MAKIYSPATQTVVDTPAAEAQQLHTQGKGALHGPQRLTKNGRIMRIDNVEGMNKAFTLGWQLIDDDEVEGIQVKHDAESTAGLLQGTAETIASSLTFGGTDLLLARNSEDEGAGLAARREALGGAAGLIDVGTTLLTGGAALAGKGAAKLTLPGLTALAGRGVQRKLAARGVGTTTALAAGGAAEAFLSAPSIEMTEAALGNREVNVEHMLAYDATMAGMIGGTLGYGFGKLTRVAAGKEVLPPKATAEVMENTLPAVDGWNTDGSIRKWAELTGNDPDALVKAWGYARSDKRALAHKALTEYDSMLKDTVDEVTTVTGALNDDLQDAIRIATGDNKIAQIAVNLPKDGDAVITQAFQQHLDDLQSSVAATLQKRNITRPGTLALSDLVEGTGDTVAKVDDTFAGKAGAQSNKLRSTTPTGRKGRPLIYGPDPHAPTSDAALGGPSTLDGPGVDVSKPSGDFGDKPFVGSTKPPSTRRAPGSKGRELVADAPEGKAPEDEIVATIDAKDAYSVSSLARADALVKRARFIVYDESAETSEKFRALLQLRQDLDSTIHKMNKPTMSTVEADTVEVLRGWADSTRKLLKDKTLLGGAADIQIETDAAMHAMLSAEEAARSGNKPVFKLLNRASDTNSGDVLKFIKAYNKLGHVEAEELADTIIEARLNYVRTVAKHYESNPEMARILSRAEESATKFRAAVGRQKDNAEVLQAFAPLRSEGKSIAHVASVIGLGVGGWPGYIAARVAMSPYTVLRGIIGVGNVLDKMRGKVNTAVAKSLRLVKPPKTPSPPKDRPLGLAGTQLLKERKEKKRKETLTFIDRLKAIAENPALMAEETGSEFKFMRNFVPQTVDGMYTRAGAAVQHLTAHIPPMYTDPYLGGEPVYDEVQMLAFERRLRILKEPMSFYDSVMRQEISAEEIDSMKALWPQLYSMGKSALVDKFLQTKNKNNIPLNNRIVLGIAFDVPVDGSVVPQVAAHISKSNSLAMQQAAPPSRKPVKINLGTTATSTLLSRPGSR